MKEHHEEGHSGSTSPFASLAEEARAADAERLKLRQCSVPFASYQFGQELQKYLQSLTAPHYPSFEA